MGTLQWCSQVASAKDVSSIALPGCKPQHPIAFLPGDPSVGQAMLWKGIEEEEEEEEEQHAATHGGMS